MVQMASNIQDGKRHLTLWENCDNFLVPRIKESKFLSSLREMEPFDQIVIYDARHWEQTQEMMGVWMKWCDNINFSGERNVPL